MINNRYFRSTFDTPPRPLFCGDERCSPGHEYGGYRPYLIIHIVRSGTGTFYCEKKTWNLKSGDAFLIFPGVKHLYQADKVNPWHYFWFAFSEELLPFLYRQGIDKKQPVLAVDNPEALFQSYLTLYALKESEGEENLLSAYGVIYQILGDLLRPHKSPAGRFSSENPIDIKKDHVMAMDTFIRTYYQTNIDVSSVAEYVNLERSYASRIFKEITGNTIGRTIRLFRLEKSRELLLKGMTVKEAALSCGFRIYENFLKAFRREFSETPSEYKQALP